MRSIYLMGKTHGYILGHRVCFGTIQVIFGLDPYKLIANIDTFLQNVSKVAEATMVQMVNFGVIDDVEIEIDVDGFDDSPMTYSLQNPARNMGVTQKNLASLTDEEKDRLMASINIEAEDVCHLEIRRDVVYFLVSKVLA